jgi:hypothetical protein
MNILIKLMSIVALVLAPWFVRVHDITDGTGEDMQAMLVETVRSAAQVFFG